MTTFREHLQNICDNFEGASVYEGYSGRSMYGRQCIGVSCDQPDYLNMVAWIGVSGAKTDSLGMGVIIYWSGMTGDEEVTMCGEGERPAIQ